jgi:hypothetical protein
VTLSQSRWIGNALNFATILRSLVRVLAGLKLNFVDGPAVPTLSQSRWIGNACKLCLDFAQLAVTSNFLRHCSFIARTRLLVKGLRVDLQPFGIKRPSPLLEAIEL